MANMKRRHALLLTAGVITLATLGVAATPRRPVPPIYSSPCVSVDGLPDAKCTPGVVRTTDVHDICTTKTGTIRPPASYTSKLKIQQMREYGFTGDPSTYEEDHLISLELGGDPRDPKNLWPEPGASPNPKDKVEGWLHKQICTGKMTPAEVQTGIRTNWKQYLTDTDHVPTSK